MGDITAANSILTISVPPLFPIPVQLLGFAADDVFDIPAIESVETLMGVDGVLSAGFVFKPLPMEVTLQADSDLNFFFDQWWTQMYATLATLSANGLIQLPAISTKFSLSNGFLTSYKPTPAARRLLQPRRFMITWNKVVPAPTL
jgi:hypothetical protein